MVGSAWFTLDACSLPLSFCQESLLKDAVGFATEHRFYLRKDGKV